MTEPLRVAHYLNQFFGGLGGEENASLGPKVMDGAVGPGLALKNAMKSLGDVVATATLVNGLSRDSCRCAAGLRTG